MLAFFSIIYRFFLIFVFLTLESAGIIIRGSEEVCGARPTDAATTQRPRLSYATCMPAPCASKHTQNPDRYSPNETTTKSSTSRCCIPFSRSLSPRQPCVQVRRRFFPIISSNNHHYLNYKNQSSSIDYSCVMCNKHEYIFRYFSKNLLWFLLKQLRIIKY